MQTISPLQTFILGVLANIIGAGFFFLPFELQFIGWVLILIGSIVLFLAGYLWFNDLIARHSEKSSK